jgi:hypothetical protein
MCRNPGVLTYDRTKNGEQISNHSGNGMAIDQVLTIHPQTDEKQLPDLTGFITCYPPIVDTPDPAPGPTCGNINAIELLTDKSPDYIFQNYLQTFKPRNAFYGAQW